MLPLKALEKNPSYPLPSLWWLSGNLGIPLVCRSPVLISDCCYMGFSLDVLSVFTWPSYKAPGLIRPSLIQYELHINLILSAKTLCPNNHIHRFGVDPIQPNAHINHKFVCLSFMFR